MSSPKKSLDEWVQVLSKAELPVLGRTVSQLASVNDYLSSHAAELVRVILHDPNMTAKVLRLANSALYNQGRKPISTVSRAIVVLGYEAIRSICLATFVLEKSASGSMQEQLLREVARSFHAAVQAKSMSQLRGDSDSEEIFIASLLFRLGEVAFWCFGDASAIAMDKALTSGMATGEAQTEILGFRFTALTLGLTREWGISPVLQEALQGRDSADSRARGIRLSHQLVLAIEKGWNEPEVYDTLTSLSRFTKVELKELRQAAYNNSLTALDTLKEFGVQGAERLLPPPPGAPSGKPVPEPPKAVQADPALQLSILRDLSTMVASNADFNLVLQHVLEGLHRGVGLERALFAIANPQRTALIGKYVVQQATTDLETRFQFQIATTQAEPIQMAMRSQDAIWARRSPKPGAMNGFLTHLKTEDFLLAPLWVNKRLVGVFYADCAPTRRALTQEDYDAFQLFVTQATLCIQMLTSRKNGQH